MSSRLPAFDVRLPEEPGCRPSGVFPKAGSRKPKAGGFTLIEVMVVVTIMAVMAGVLLPLMVGPSIASRRSETGRKMAAIEEAILGRPELGDPGFLATMGRLPDNLGVDGMTDLVVKCTGCDGNRFEQVNGHLTAVVHGWNGPYLRLGSRNPLQDVWGSPLVVDKDVLDGQQVWRLHSYGPDRNRFVGSYGQDDDDIVFPSSTTWWNWAGQIAVAVLNSTDSAFRPVPGTALQSVTLFYQSGEKGTAAEVKGLRAMGVGAPEYQCATCVWVEDQGQAIFNTAGQIPFGTHVVEVKLADGTPFYREVVLARPSSKATVSVPLGPSVPTVWLSTDGTPSTVSAVEAALATVGPLEPNTRSVLIATATGQVVGSGANPQCRVVIQFSDEWGAAAPNPAVVGAFGILPEPAASPATVAAGAVAQGFSTTRSYSVGPFVNPTRVYVKLFVSLYSGGGGPSCTVPVSGAALSVAVLPQ